jgi:hypothetical protein
MGRPGNGRRERRRDLRFGISQAVLLIPVTPDGRPDRDRRTLGRAVDVSAGGMGLECDAPGMSSVPALIVGARDAGGNVCFAGLEVRAAWRSGRGRVRIGGRFGGLSHEILNADNLKHTLDPASLKFTLPFPEDLLRSWAEIGLLERVTRDRVQLCPRCHALPSFRQGCPVCGCAQTAADQFIHHFGCAHVAPVAAFQAGEELVCPKCRTRRLVVGADFEYLPGASRCPDCHWTGTELEHVGQCLRCDLRFPGYQALTQDLCTYHAHRLDPLALIAHP